MAFPSAVLGSVVAAGEEPAIELAKDPGRVEGFQTARLHATAAAFFHLIQNGDMVGEAELPRRHCAKQGRKATLALHVNERLVFLAPVQRREGLTLQNNAKRDPLTSILSAADAAPEGKVIDELQELKVLAVANDGPQNLSHEAPLHAVAATLWVLRVLRILGPFNPLPLQSTGISGSLHRLAHARAPVEGWPQGALDAGRLDELQGPPAVRVRGIGVLPQKLVVLLHQIPVGAVCLLRHQVFVGFLELLALAARLYLDTGRVWQARKKGCCVTIKQYPNGYDQVYVVFIPTLNLFSGCRPPASAILSLTDCSHQLIRVIDAFMR